MPYHGSSLLRGDKCICDAARLSTSKTSKTVKDDIRLLKRLMDDNHTSPFEAAELKFIINAPLFVARQLLRHRTASVNEFSFRYTQLPDNGFYNPTSLVKQSQVNKQLSDHSEPVSTDVFTNHNEYCEDLYQKLIFDEGASREIARFVLPQTTMTRFMFKIDLHNFLKFLSLRSKPDVQRETKLLAMNMGVLAARMFPVSLALWAVKEIKASWAKEQLAEINTFVEQNSTLGVYNNAFEPQFKCMPFKELAECNISFSRITNNLVDLDNFALTRSSSTPQSS